MEHAPVAIIFWLLPVAKFTTIAPEQFEVEEAMVPPNCVLPKTVVEPNVNAVPGHSCPVVVANEANEVKRLVDDAVVAKELVVVAYVVVAKLKLANRANRFVEDAVVANALVVVAYVVVEKLKFANRAKRFVVDAIVAKNTEDVAWVVVERSAVNPPTKVDDALV